MMIYVSVPGGQDTDQTNTMKDIKCNWAWKYMRLQKWLEIENLTSGCDERDILHDDDDF